jgi:hypothetical protein
MMAGDFFSMCEGAMGPVWGIMAGGVFASLVALGVMIAFLVVAGLYVFHSLAWSAIAKKLKYKRPWLAWIPFANIAMIFQLGKFHWAWVFLLLIPFAGWIAVTVLAIISMWRIFEKLRWPGWFSLGVVIPRIGGILYLVAIGFVAWGENNFGKRR